MQPPAEYVRTKADEAAVSAGCWWHPESAERVRSFFLDFLRHSKGEWAGQKFEFLPWQWDDIIRPLFSWKRADGTRRYRSAYIEVPKKNGKSTLCAGLSLYFLIDDDEPGAEVYSAAADRDQASIIFREAAQMVRSSPELSDHVEVIPSTKRLVFPRTGSYYKALSADAYRQEGLNISALIFEELHAQRTRDLWDALVYGGAARRQPLAIAVTTAGWNRNSICWEQRQIAEQILDGTFDDWSIFPLIAAADPEADWTDPAVWRKANPSYGVTIKHDEFAEACKQAQASPTKENSFKRYRLSIWTEQAVRWLQMEAWDACDGAVDPEALKGRDCYAGLDLSSKLDITALVLVFPPTPDDVLWRLMPFFWIPEDNARERERRDKVPYTTWARQGFIATTPENVIDYNFIESRILELGSKYNIIEVAFDPWGAQHTATNLDREGVPVIEFRQGYKSLSEPTKELERLIVGGKVAHGGHPVLRWMARNVTVVDDDAGNLKITKKKSTEKVDGIAAAIMGIGRAMVQDRPAESIYETRGFEVLSAERT